MHKRLVVQPQYCIGCKACEMACAFTHGDGGQPGTPRVSVQTVAPKQYVPMLCLQCDEAACMAACPVEAITRNPDTGVVKVNMDKCVLCMACTVACPFGNMHVESVLSNAVVKCDLCEDHGGIPRCAQFCPTGCLSVETLDD